MKNIIVLFVFISIALTANTQTIYSKAFGDSEDEPIIFLHGGPGYNAMAFEISTAHKLAENGFYVIVYDRRGEGRSPDQNAKFTFDETFNDLDAIYQKYNLNKATLIGHSFGGILGTLYADKMPDKVNNLVLAAAPIAMQETFSTILKSSKEIYQKNEDSSNLMYIGMLEKMDQNSLEYSSYCFGHAMQNGFYSPKMPSKEAMVIYENMKTDTLFINKGSLMTYEAPRGFWENESYTSIDITKTLKKVLKREIPIFGIYGIEDGLYSKEQVLNLKDILGVDHFNYLENCSHNVFIDQQNQFINALNNWIL